MYPVHGCCVWNASLAIRSSFFAPIRRGIHRGIMATRWNDVPSLLWASVAASLLLTAGTATGASWRTPVSILESCSEIDLDGIGGVFVACDETTPYRFGALKLDASTGAELWAVDLPPVLGFDNYLGAAMAIGTDLLVAGEVQNAVPPGSQLSVFRLDGATGTTTWEYATPGADPSQDDNRAQDLAVYAGDVIVGGYVAESHANENAFVAKLDGATGAELWRFEIDDSGQDDKFYDVAVDSAGDVFASGYLRTGLFRFFTIKLDGATGAEIWRVELPEYTSALYTTIDPADDLFVAAGGFEILKLDGATGAELWRVDVDGSAADVDHVYDLESLTGGDLIAAGFVSNDKTQYDLTVLRIDGTTGATVWRSEFDHNKWRDRAYDAEVDPSGDILVGGQFSNSFRDRDFAALKLDGATGALLWSQSTKGEEKTERNRALAVALDGAGNPYMAGRDGVSDVVALDAATGIVGAIHGRKLKVSDQLNRTDRRAVTALLSENAILTPAPGSPNDPTVAGATVELVNPITLESASFALPGGPAWKGLGSPPGAKGYSYSDKSGQNGPCKTLRVRPGRSLKVTCNGKLAPIPFSLDEPTQDELILSVRFGAAPAQCGIFGGDISADAGIGNPSLVGRFKSKSALPTGSCP